MLRAARMSSQRRVVVVKSVHDNEIARRYMAKAQLANAFKKLVVAVISQEGQAVVTGVVYVDTKLIVYLRSASFYLIMQQFTDDIMLCCAQSQHLPRVNSLVFKVDPLANYKQVTEAQALPTLPISLAVSLEKLATKMQHPGLKQSLSSLVQGIKNRK